MDKNTVVGFLLMALVLIGFSYYSSQQTSQQNVTTAPTNKNQPAHQATPTIQDVDTTDLFANHLKGRPNVITLQNNKVKVFVSTKGGIISKVELKEYKNQQKTNVVLFSEKTASIDFTLRGKDKLLHTQDYYFTPTQISDTSVTMQISDSKGKPLE